MTRLYTGPATNNMQPCGLLCRRFLFSRFFVTACGVDQEWKYFKSSCYKYFAQPLTWSNAKSHCQALSGGLVIFHTAEVHKFVTNDVLPAAYGRVWIGLNRDASDKQVWKWEDGSLLSFDQWQHGEPNRLSEDCAQMMDGEHYGSQWNNGWLDISCSNPDGALICERKANVETDP